MKRPRLGPVQLSLWGDSACAERVSSTRAAVLLQTLCRAWQQARRFDEWKRARFEQTLAALEYTAATATVYLTASICRVPG